jgi:3-hydroxymyristoyl/3-hydroxydecanoyl-(acyl carrier protein) dehydratase
LSSLPSLAPERRSAFGAEEILRRIPHGREALLLSSVRLCPPRSVSAEVHLDGAERHFRGHFSDGPVLPGHVLLEMFGQAGALLIHELGFAPNLHVMAGIERFRFRKAIRPPAALSLDVRVRAISRNTVWLSCVASLPSVLALPSAPVAAGTLVVCV